MHTHVYCVLLAVVLGFLNDSEPLMWWLNE